MKKIYQSPMAYEEIFTADNYCTSACWGVACDVNSSNNFEYNYRPSGYQRPGDYSNMLSGYSGDPHTSDHCGQAKNQYIKVENGVAVSMKEQRTWSLGDLNCTLYTNSSYNRLADYSKVSPGQTIYWTTSSGNKTWHHQGKVTTTYPGRPNHS